MVDFTPYIYPTIAVAIQVATVSFFMGSNSSKLRALGDRIDLLSGSLDRLKEDAKGAYNMRTETLKDIERLKVTIEHLVKKIDQMCDDVRKN